MQHNNQDIIEEGQWIVVVEQEHIPNRRFICTVKRIMHLLVLRRIFARAGNYLGTSISRRPENANIRAVMTHIFTQWPRTVLKNSKNLFDHLKRYRGKLVYKK